MKRDAILLLAGCMWGITPLHAQELPAERFSGADTAAMVLLPAALPPLSADWIRQDIDPIERERRQLRSLSEELARRSVVESPKTRGGTDSGRQAWLRHMQIGNTSVGNWSPFPDRALDARTIRFPLPRDARADKRSQKQKALDRIRGRN